MSMQQQQASNYLCLPAAHSFDQSTESEGTSIKPSAWLPADSFSNPIRSRSDRDLKAHVIFVVCCVCAYWRSWQIQYAIRSETHDSNTCARTDHQPRQRRSRWVV